MATEVAVLLLGGVKLILGPGVFTVGDLRRDDMPSKRKVDWLLLMLSAPGSLRGPLYFSMGQPEVSLCLSGKPQLEGPCKARQSALPMSMEAILTRMPWRLVTIVGMMEC
eukprot:1153324-Pelagomonas_calceolata.AAC.1